LELAAFVAVVKHGGFAAAARAAGLRKATLSERVRMLEERLDVKLLVRSTRTLRVTDEGRAFDREARRALAAASAAESAVLEMRAKPSGTLRISVTPTLAAVLADAVIAPYMCEHPEVAIEIDATTRSVDLLREGYDLAIRVGRLADSSLTVRRLGHAHGGYFASRAYLARKGTPEFPEDLAHHDTIAMPRGDRLPEWHFVNGRRKRTVVVHPRVFASSFELGIVGAVAGLGVVPCTHTAARPYLAKKQLVPVLESWTPPAFEVNAVFPSGAALVPKTRLMIDALSSWFAAQGGRI
jgi:DNA-binding transcriptional LysR family regulator